MTTLRRVARAAIVFLGTGFALLAIGAQFAPGWRPATTQAELALQPLPPAKKQPPQRIERTPVDLADGARAWIVRPESPTSGVVLVPGSGGADRDAMLDDAETLARAGIAAITYDKRTDGYSFFERDFHQLARDAVAAADALAKHTDRVGILGFSEGSWVAALALDQRPEQFSFAVLASAPIVSPLDQSIWTTQRALAWAPEWVRRIPATALAGGRWFDFVTTDIRLALRELRVPVYAVWGADDAIVPVAIAARTLAANVRTPITARILPDTGHLLETDWLDDAADWITTRPGNANDDLRGAQPATLLGLATAPRNAWFLNPVGHLALALALAIPAFLLPRRKKPE